MTWVFTLELTGNSGCDEISFEMRVEFEVLKDAAEDSKGVVVVVVVDDEGFKTWRMKTAL